MSRGVNIEELEPLKKAYNKAVELEMKEFQYRGATLITDFAKYLIEHMESIKSKK